MPGPALSWTRPPALRKGAVVGVCAPAGPVDAGALDRGVAELEAMGFGVRLAEGVRSRTRFTAGPTDERVRDLHALFADPAVGAIFAARGGAGAGRLLPLLDAGLVRANPKPVVGYSDLTALHLYMNRLKLVTFHGPLVARELADGRYDRDSLHAALSGGSRYVAPVDELLPIAAGHAEGRLLGGCLSLLAAAAGTPWALPADEDAILFVEDVDEPPYRIDRMLLQLRESGAFARVKGVVLGDMHGCSPAIDAGYGLEDVIHDALRGLEIPIALGLSSGHTSSPFVTLPLGVRAHMVCDAGEARFEVLEDAVA